jgi:hypothetical protein
MVYQLQLSTLDKVDHTRKNLKAAQAMGYNTNRIRQQGRFLNAVQNDSLLKRINSLT